MKTSSKKAKTALTAKSVKGKAKAVPDKKVAVPKGAAKKALAKVIAPVQKAVKVAVAKPTPSKAPAKSSVKPPVKAPVRAAAKPAKKAVAKGASKGLVKSPIKVAVTVVKGAKTAASKTAKTPTLSKKSPAVKAPSVKAKSAQAPLAKALPVKAAIKTKPAATTAPKALAAPSKPSPAPKAKAASAPTSQKAASASEAKSMTVKKVATPSPAVEPVTVTAVAPSAPDQLVRATRPSARLAQITVPSLPPAVASTAAKASFMPSAPVAMVAAPFLPLKKDPKLANHWKTKKLDELTDADILAMPDAEYMNSVQMAYYRRKLSVLKQDILNSAGATTEHLREDTVVVPDPADRATIEEEHALELRTRDRERKLLKKIEQSIHLIDAGEYGYCDETGEPIGVGRLLARPTATLSLEAQQRRELKQKMFGD